MPWSAQHLNQSRSRGLAVNIVIYAELIGHPGFNFDLDAFLSDQSISMLEISRTAAREAALAFRSYRQRGGSRTGVLPDFFIGAQALAEGCPLMTRDAARYRTYFHSIELICP